MIEFLQQHAFLLFGAGYVLAHLLGLGMALHAILNGRTPQGTVAWLMALIAMPALAIPFYLFFGSPRFWGYIRARRAGDSRLTPVVEELIANARGMDVLPEQTRQFMRVSSALARMPFSRGNAAELLIDGEATFDAICAAIAGAEHYVLVQFYIIHDDGLGRRFRDVLLERARAGVRVHLLYDEVGCWALPRAYLEQLREAGVEVSGFTSIGRRRSRFRINFRNHRKVVVVDGRVAFLGGHNVGDEYLGLDPKLGHWRDTHVALRGPVVHAVQLAFLEDWYWSTERIPQLDWQPRMAAEPGVNTLVLPSGPADELDTFAMYILEAINAARHRLWIVSPYFVPDEGVIYALQLAAL
ncbi:MAG: cardiolipin synthase, partial [Gammaproteobacteria bacterium]